MKTAETVGRTVDEAVSAALKQIRLDRDRVQIEVLDEGSRGILGIGAKMARVRVTELQKISAPASVAINFLHRVAALMDLPEPTVNVTEDGDNMRIEVEGDNVGPMIGHHGDALDALQLLTGLVVNPQGHDSEQYFHVTLDVSNYRQRREETLKLLATKLAQRAVQTGEKQELEPMNSYERRIIHTVLAEIPGISTWSEGDDPYRHVIIASQDSQNAEIVEEE